MDVAAKLGTESQSANGTEKTLPLPSHRKCPWISIVEARGYLSIKCLNWLVFCFVFKLFRSYVSSFTQKVGHGISYRKISVSLATR